MIAEAIRTPGAGKIGLASQLYFSGNPKIAKNIASGANFLRTRNLFAIPRE
jgi:hypothetical protein